MCKCDGGAGAGGDRQCGTRILVSTSSPWVMRVTRVTRPRYGLRRGGQRLRDRQVRSDGRPVHRVPQRGGGDRHVRAVHGEHVVERFGCKIQRIGTAGSYTYSVAADRANRPVNWVSWGDAARFTNWLHNGQPIGAQGLGTTENGAYYLNGAIPTRRDGRDAQRRTPSIGSPRRTSGTRRRITRTTA